MRPGRSVTSILPSGANATSHGWTSPFWMTLVPSSGAAAAGGAGSINVARTVATTRTRRIKRHSRAAGPQRAAVDLPVLLVVGELQGQILVVRLEHCLDLLQVVPALARDPQLLTLDRRLHLQLAGLDELDHGLGLVAGDALDEADL